MTGLWSNAAHRLRSSLCRLAVAATVTLAAPVVAQTEPDTPKVATPLQVIEDPNGVNLATGKLVLDTPTLSIPAAPRLQYDWMQNTAPYVLQNIVGPEADSQTASYSFHIGARSSESFSCANSFCENLSASGSVTGGRGKTLIVVGSGAKFYFSLLHSVSTSPGRTTKQFYADKVEYPDGEVITYAYDSLYEGGPYNRTWYRPNKISSSLGYYIEFTYPSDFTDLTYITPDKIAIYKLGAPTVALAQLTREGGGMKDLLGRVFKCSGCPNAMGAELEVASGSVTLPGETTPTKQVTQVSGANLVSTVNVDGDVWSYTYANYHYDVTPRYTGPRYDSVTVTGPEGFQQFYTIEARGSGNVVASVRDSINRTTSYVVDGNMRPVKVINPEQDSVQLTLDDFGNITQKVTARKPGTTVTPATLTQSGGIGSSGCQSTPVLCYRLTWTMDARGGQTDYVYNSAGQPTQITEPPYRTTLRRRTIIEYETSAGISRKRVQSVCTFDEAPGGAGTTCASSRNVPNGQVCPNASELRTEYAYGSFTMLPSAVTQFDCAANTSLATTYTYDGAGRVLSTDGPLPGDADATFMRYDAVGRKTWEIGAADSVGHRTAKNYATLRDADDKPTKVSTGWLYDKDGTVLQNGIATNIIYDTGRNPRKETVTAASTTFAVTSRTFDNRNRLVCEAVRMNLSVAVPSDGCTQTQGAVGPYGPDRITKNLWDAASQLKKIQKAVGTSQVQDYVSYEYTPNGKQSSVTDAGGAQAALIYDGYDRLFQWQFPSATSGAANTNDFEQYGYDENGNRTSLRKRDGRTLTFSYDGLNRMTKKVVSQCGQSQPSSCLPAGSYRDVYYGHDLRNNQLSARFDGTADANDGVTSTYDGFGRLKSSRTRMLGTSRVLTYDYNAASDRIQVTQPGGVSFATTFDPAHRMVHADWTVATGPTAGTVPFMQITYDGSGRRTDINRASSYTGYGYDAAGRLQLQNQRFAGIPDATWNFGYNPAGQLASQTRGNAWSWNGFSSGFARSYDANKLNQYTQAGQTAFRYDPNGNLTSNAVSGGATTTYGYDGENRLISSTTSGGTSLVYDPLGRLFQVSSANPVSTTQFLYDGDDLALEYDGSGTIKGRYFFGPGEDEPILVSADGTMNCDTTRFLHTDHQGSIVAVANCGGAQTATNGYDEYGIPNGRDVGGERVFDVNWGRFQYTGQAWLPELGMYYYKARMYSASLGRFMQTDPVGYKDQMNLYAYIGNDPVNGRDPTGTYSCTGTRICPEFNTAQKEVIKQLKIAIKQLKELATAIRNGDSSPASARTLANQMEKYIGRDSSRSLSAVLGLEARGVRALSGLMNDGKSAVFNPGLASGAGHVPVPGRLEFGEHPTKGTVFHETSHETSFAARGGFVRDNAGPAGQYGEAAARALARSAGPSWTLTTANSLTYAFGFGDDD